MIGDASSYAAALFEALARDEAAGRRGPRLTEAGQATWQRFRGRLGSADLLRLLVEDTAVLHPIPFTPGRIGVSLDDVEDATVDKLLAELPRKALLRPRAEYIEAQAQLLGIPTKLARSELHQVTPHQKVLELPGTGGQPCHHLVTTQPGLTLQLNCTILGGSWAELVLAGIVALDLGAPSSELIVAATAEHLMNDQHPVRQGGSTSSSAFVRRRAASSRQLTSSRCGSTGPSWFSSRTSRCPPSSSGWGSRLTTPSGRPCGSSSMASQARSRSTATRGSWSGRASCTRPTPVPTPRPQLDLFDVGAKAGSLGVPEELLAKLGSDERTFLVLLKENGTLKTSEVVMRMKKTAPRVNGLVVQLHRKLHAASLELFVIETLPNGETQFRYTRTS